jgi:hypothetical protein
MPDQNDHPERLSERLKEDLEHLQIEQLPPNQPSFITVVLLFAAAFIIILILAIFFLHLDKGKLFRHGRSHPTSQLVLPHYPSSVVTLASVGQKSAALRT